MRIYEVKKHDQTIGFARSFDQARAMVREDDPAAKKTGKSSMVEGWFFSNQMAVWQIDIKPDKEGIINKLNSLLEEKANQPEPEPTPEPMPQPVAVETTTPIGISPAIEFTGKGQGTCLHCNKTVGYVGGFPQVNPPDAIRDK